MKISTEILEQTEKQKWGYRQPVILVESQSAPVLFGDPAEQAYMRGCNIAKEGDLVVTDFPLNRLYVEEYLGGILGFDLPEYLVVDRVGAGCLSDNLLDLRNQDCLRAIEQFWLAKGRVPRLQFFNVTEHELSLMRTLRIETTCGDPKMAIEVGSKPGFRRLCESLGIPMPKGIICRDLGETIEAVSGLLAEGKEAMIKTENGTGGTDLKSNVVIRRVGEVSEKLADFDGFLGKEWVVEEKVEGDDGSIHVFIQDDQKAEKSYVLGAISSDNSYVGGYFPFEPSEEQVRMMELVDEVLVPRLQGLGVYGHHCLDFKGGCFLEDNARPGALDFIHGMVARIAEKHFGDKPYAYWHCHVSTGGPTNFDRVYGVLSEYLDPQKAQDGCMAMVSNQEVLPFGRSLDLTTISFGDDASVEKAKAFFDMLAVVVKEKL
ncbi:hypothetical protein HYU91_01710 [Candidatus Collierbacteria bacterium]|nr:hypothetical protein [Candidatus Collierbacteria bacterium]